MVISAAQGDSRATEKVADCLNFYTNYTYLNEIRLFSLMSRTDAELTNYQQRWETWYPMG